MTIPRCTKCGGFRDGLQRYWCKKCNREGAQESRKRTKLKLAVSDTERYCRSINLFRTADQLLEVVAQLSKRKNAA